MSAPEESRPTTILVTGDIVVDHHLYAGEQEFARAAPEQRGTIEVTEFGGAALIEALLDCEDEQAAPWRAVLGLVKDPTLYQHCFAVWKPTDRGAQGNGVGWRATERLGYGPGGAPALGRGPSSVCPQVDPAAPTNPDILVLDDAGGGFRSRETCWPACLAASTPPSWVVWKMAGELRGGPLWQHATANGTTPSRTVLVVSAADLRRAGLDISQGLSWERTALDTEVALRETTLEPLRSSRHVIVSFQGAGVLWVDRADSDSPRCTLVYDPHSVADDAVSSGRGEVFGHQACLSAGIVWELARVVPRGGGAEAEMRALDGGISRGMRARRLLFTIGHDRADEALPRGFPAERIRREALREPLRTYARAVLPQTSSESWTILADAASEAGLSGPLYQHARLVAKHGIEALRGMPMLQVGAFLTVDRSEIESLRRIQQLVADYERSRRPSQPLSIAVFGPPGSGKSFLVKQIAASVTPGKLLEFNLSQISDERELIGAFHQVRDRALTGETPFVFWDEFDSQEYRWLRLLLAPMQDGCFLEGQVTHPIGKCVFVFAGGTSWRSDEFGPWNDPGNPAESAREERIWRLCKGPDFESRLSGSLDVLGPNRRTLRRPTRGAEPVEDEEDEADVCFPIRRATFLRADRGLEADDPLDLSTELLDGLLAAPRYKHGSRSFKRVLANTRPGRFLSREDRARDLRGTIDDLPAADWLPQFTARRAAELQRAEEDHAKLLMAIESDIDKFAAQINAAYMTLPAGDRSSDITAEFSALGEFAKKSNRAAAHRVPVALRAAGMLVCVAEPPDALTLDHASAWLRRFVDLAAAEEHKGWCEFHESNGWCYADIPEKDAAECLHPALVNWKELSEANRDKDRYQVGVYLKIVYDLGYAVRLG